MTFNEQGTPVAEDFDDVYFSNENGLAESNYVFLQHNQLPQRWKHFDRENFVIAETGFGTGLNFLAAWHAFNQANKSTTLTKLHFISFEQFPISKDDLTKALDSWPELSDLSHQIIDKYPILVAGCHRLNFENITLDLWFADVNASIKELYRPENGLIDCWFLDGFAPSKNPEMWTGHLFSQMARLAKTDATFATFTAAGMVKRGLINAGFDVTKTKGFGSKREMLVGKLANDYQPPKSSQAYYSRYVEKPSNTISIIGGGLAAANAAYALAKRGYKITLYCKDTALAQGASGNHSGGFYPLLHAEHDIVSQIYCHSYLLARTLYDELVENGFDFGHQWCGTLQVAYNEKTLLRLNKIASNEYFISELVFAVDKEKATEIAGLEIPYPALFYPLAGWINPPSLVIALINAAKNITDVDINLDCHITNLKQTDKGWLLQTNDTEKKKELEASTVILANGNHIHNFEQTKDLPFAPVRGQVSLLQQDSSLAPLKTVLCHKGYATPIWQNQQCIGSTFIKQSSNTDYREDEQAANLKTLQSCFPQQQWAQDLSVGNNGRAGIRCTSPDHLPLVGAVPNLQEQTRQYAGLHKNRDSAVLAENYPNLLVLSALGSRGLCSAPLMAEILACQINNEPMPLADTLLNALNPNRFLIRRLIRNQ